MKLSKALLGAILVGIAVQTTSCSKKDKEVTPQPTGEQVKHPGETQPENCPACGMG